MKLKLIAFLLFTILLFLSCAERDLFINPNPNPGLGGDYTEIKGRINGTLKSSDSPFYVSQTITVEPGDTLIIEPGVELFFASASQIKISGTLIAEGTVQNKINFKPFSYDWMGIHISNTNTESILKFCIISDVYLPQDSSVREGAVEFTNAAGEISNCYFTQNYTTFGGAIYSENSSLTITNNVFYRNEAIVFGGAIYSNSSSNKIYNNTAYRNVCINYGGGFVFDNAINEDVQNNILYRNFSYSGDPRIAILNSDSSDVQLQFNFLGSDNSNPMFISEENYHLQPNSPCRDAGNPDPIFNDVDGTRNDQGAYGGPGGEW